MVANCMGESGIGVRRSERRGGLGWGRPAAAVVVGLAAWAHGGVAGAGADDDGWNSPLADLFGYDSMEPAEQRRQQLEVEELTAECMRAEGWEYEPVDWSAMAGSMNDAEDIELQMNDPQAYGERYGYGVMRNYELYEAAWLEDPETAMEAEDDTFVDPNQEFVESLSEAEREQYYESLYGEMSISSEDSVFEDSEIAEPDPEDMGCSGQAQNEVYGGGAGIDPDVQGRIEEYFETIGDDPRLADARADWLECMGDGVEGYTGWDGGPVDDPEDMWSVFETKKNEALGLEMRAFEDESEIADEEYYTSQIYEDGSGVAWLGEPSPIPDDEVAAITEEEIDTWQRDQECQADSDVSGVTRELEQELVDQLLEEFPELASTGSSSED
ncbi:MAG: hypothetical protein ACK5OX_02820 [Desertimonas sp.]